MFDEGSPSPGLPRPDIIVPLTTEPISKQFPFSDYHYWRDGLQALNSGHRYNSSIKKFERLILPGETEESSSALGLGGYLISTRTLSGLREGRKDVSGKPIILCIDEVPDAQVLRGVTPQAREEFTRKAVAHIPSRFNIEPMAYANAAVATTAILTGNEISKASEIVREVIPGADIMEERKADFVRSLGGISDERVKTFLSYIKAAKQMLIWDEKEYTRINGPRRFADFHEAYVHSYETGEPLDLLGRQFAAGESTTGPREQYVLNSTEKTMVEPLLKAIHQGRQAMIDSAIALAVEEFGLDPQRAYLPPEHWRYNTNDRGLSSDEVLVFVPRGEGAKPKNNAPPNLFTNFPGGWHIVKIGHDTDGNPTYRYFESFS